MAVFELEQRFLPLIESQHVWQPWGVAGRYCLDEEGNVSESSTCSGSARRARSWGGYASYAMRRRFSNPEHMAEDVEQLKEEVAEQAQEIKGASWQRISANEFQHILLVEDENICQGWSKPAAAAEGSLKQGLHSAACFSSECWQKEGSNLWICSESTTFSSEGSGPSFSSEGASNCFSSEASSAIFCSEASAVAFSSEASSRPKKERRRRKAAAASQTSKTTGSFASVMMAREEEGSAGGPEITTLMVQNVPHNLSRDELLAEVERTGFPAGEGGYNFCHLPRIFKTGKNQGFAFLNFASQSVAERFAKKWHNNYSLLQGGLQRALRVKVAAVQGIEACEQFAQSKKMQRVKTGTFKPLVVAAAEALAGTSATVWPALH